MSYLIQTRRLRGEEFEEYLEFCRKVARFDRINKVWVIDEDKIRRLDPDEASYIAARLADLGVKGVEEILRLSDSIPKIDYSFNGNFLELRFRSEEDYEKGLIFGETQCTYAVRKFDPHSNSFVDEVVRRYWGYRDTLKIRTFRGLWPRATKFFELSPKEPYALIDFDESDISFLRDYQKDALIHVLTQMEDCGCATLQAATGSGKTEIAVATYLATRPEKCFFLSLNTDLLIQAKDRFRKYGVRAGLVNKDHFEIDEPVVCCTVQTLFRAIKDVVAIENPYGNGDEVDDEVKPLLEETDVEDKKALVDMYKNAELVIIDECQHVPARTVWTCAIANTDALRLALSATPWRDDGRDLDIYCAMGDPVPRKITSSELIDRGYLVPAEIYFVHYRPEWAEEFNNKIKRKLYQDSMRNELIAKLARKAPKPFMCLVKEVSHGELIVKAMQKEGLKVKFVYGEMNPDERARIFDLVRAGRIDGIIATTLADEIAVGGKSLLIKSARVVTMNYDEIEKQAIEEYLRGIRGREIVRKYGISPKTLYNWLKKHNIKPWKKPIEPNKELGYIIGLIIADGYIEKQETSAIVVFSNTEKTLVDNIVRIGRSIGIKFHEVYINKKLPNGKIEYKTHACCTWLARMIESFKTTIINSELEVKKGFLGGFLDGDGSIIISEFYYKKKGHCHYVTVSFTTTNNDIIEVICKILSEMGFKYHIEKGCSGYKNAKTPYRIRVEGIAQSIKLLSQIPFYHPEKITKYNRIWEIIDSLYYPSRRYVMGLISQPSKA